MNVGFYATRVQAEVMKVRDEIESAYDRYPDATMFWCLIDLKGSSNYRIVRGAKDGYVRGEMFFTLVRSVVEVCADVRVIKEMGDGALLAASSFRPLFESVVLMDQTAHQLASIKEGEQIPFALRAGIGFGPAKRLTRGHEDYLGSPIDQLARILSLKTANSNLLVHEEAYRPSSDILREYQAFLRVSEAQLLSASASKDMVRPVYYRELQVGRPALVEFSEHFMPWRQTPQTAVSERR